MRELNFIRHNLDKWRKMERNVEHADKVSPDELADTYTELTADLSFAQTNYPDSRITIYLNNLTSALHNHIYRNKQEKKSRLYKFWTEEVPGAMFEARKELLISFLIFIIAMAIGFLSGIKDPEYARQILGDSYVDMTLENIRDGRPMGVYASDGQSEMFLSITLNNILVSFKIFISGIFTVFLTGIILIVNGVMIGSFQSLLYQHGVLAESMLAVFLHGTLELAAIIVAGAAGILLGTGWLIPGSYSRLDGFRHSAKKGVKIIIGAVPVFVLAGFIEGFITRYTEQPNSLRITWIVISTLFVIFYYVILPIKTHKNGRKKIDKTLSETNI